MLWLLSCAKVWAVDRRLGGGRLWWPWFCGGQHEVLEDRIRSQIVEVWDWRWPQHLILVFPATEVHSGERSSAAGDGPWCMTPLYCTHQTRFPFALSALRCQLAIPPPTPNTVDTNRRITLCFFFLTWEKFAPLSAALHPLFWCAARILANGKPFAKQASAQDEVATDMINQTQKVQTLLAQFSVQQFSSEMSAIQLPRRVSTYTYRTLCSSADCSDALKLWGVSMSTAAEVKQTPARKIQQTQLNRFSR